MNSQSSSLPVVLLLVPLAFLLAAPSAAQDSEPSKTTDRSNAPDLVITEDSQLALSGKTGKAVIGSCEQDQPLWKGKIALKNIGRTTVYATPPPAARLEPTRPQEWPHVRAYVPNNIVLMAEDRLEHDLGEFGQELIELEIGKGEPKCRNYGAPPVFDERLSGRPGPIFKREGPPEGLGPEGPYMWRIKRIQRALIDKGYSVTDDGDYGPQTIRAVAAYFKDHRRTPPPEVFERPLSPEMANFLLEVLGAERHDERPEPGPGPVVAPSAVISTGGDECVRGINLVPIYIEIDPERQIPDENRSNNRVQFTVAIDCSNVAR